jgi:hypothetical protein
MHPRVLLGARQMENLWEQLAGAIITLIAATSRTHKNENSNPQRV